MSALLLADAKKHLNITSDAQETEIQQFIDAAEAAIETIVGPLEPRTVTATVRPGSASTLLLPILPAISLTTVTPTGGTAIAGNLFDLDPFAGLVMSFTGTASFSSRSYQVAYMAGRDPIPADLMMAVKEMLRHLWTTQRGPTARPGSQASDALANTLAGAAYSLPIRVMQLLGPHTMVGFA